MPPLAGLPVRLRCPGELAAQPHELSPLIARHSHHRIAGRLGQVAAGALDLFHRLRPFSVQLHDLTRFPHFAEGFQLDLAFPAFSGAHGLQRQRFELVGEVA